MPTYEYKCPAGHVFEKFFRKITDQRRARCPECGKRAERLISGGAALVFKGSGFYATDYKHSGESKKSDGDAAPSTDKKSSDTSKKPSDSKKD